MSPCPNCHGKGNAIDAEGQTVVCCQCRGSGRVAESEAASPSPTPHERVSIPQVNHPTPIPNVPIPLDQIQSEWESKAFERTEAIRKAISEWANRIPHHDLRNLGEKIEIRSIFERPVYRAVLQTEYEKRELQKGTKPYRREPIPRKAVNEEGLDVWKFGGSEVGEFEERHDDITINGSQEVRTCEKCEGKGEIKCPELKCRNGSVRCDDCDGKGEVRCGNCGGKGEVQCGIFLGCGGKGFKERNGRQERCGSCAGRGSTACAECRNGWSNCSACGSKGEVRCSDCGGRGIQTCDSCEGAKRIVSFLHFSNDFNPAEDANEIIHPDCPISPDEFQEDQEPGNLVYEVTQAKLSPECFSGLTHEKLKEEVLSLLTADDEPVAVTPQGGCRIVRQRVRIYRIIATTVAYSHSGKGYALWVYGNDDKVFTQENPIAEMANLHFEMARDLFGKMQSGDYLHVHDLLKKVLEMKVGRHVHQAERLRRRVLGRVWTVYALWGAAGGAVATIFMLLDSNQIWFLLLWTTGGLVVGLIAALAVVERLRTSLGRFLMAASAALVVIAGVLVMGDFKVSRKGPNWEVEAKVLQEKLKVAEDETAKQKAEANRLAQVNFELLGSVPFRFWNGLEGFRNGNREGALKELRDILSENPADPMAPLIAEKLRSLENPPTALPQTPAELKNPEPSLSIAPKDLERGREIGMRAGLRWKPVIGEKLNAMVQKHGKDWVEPILLDFYSEKGAVDGYDPVNESPDFKKGWLEGCWEILERK